MPLTPEQIAALKTVPLGAMPNKVRIARQMAGIDRQADLARQLDMTSPELSDLERGAYKDVPLEKGRRVAQFFGCAIEDLFPAREAVAS